VVPEQISPKVGWLVGCEAGQGTAVHAMSVHEPNGYMVVTLIDALRGHADADKNGIVTVGEVCDYVPSRSTKLAELFDVQDSFAALHDDLKKHPLTRTMDPLPATCWTYPKQANSRNPWGLIDVPMNITAKDERPEATDLGKADDPNAEAWTTVKGGDTLEGKWDSRYDGKPPVFPYNGCRVQLREHQGRVFISYVDNNSPWLVEAIRSDSDPHVLIGACYPTDTTELARSWTGRIVGNTRIDGVMRGPKKVRRWDFRRAE
jgi:hypothetical protein